MAQIKKDTSLRKAILQAAITGQLISTVVEPVETTETGKQLLDRIIEERNKKLLAEWEEALKKNPKAKKPTPIIASEIDEDEIPFEIPENWCWCRIQDICLVKGGKRIPAGCTLTEADTGHKYIRVADMKNGSVIVENVKYITDEIHDKIKAYKISKDDVYITVAGTIGDSGIVPDELDNANLTENADKLVLFNGINKYCLHFFLSSGFFQEQISDAITKVGQPKLAITRIQNFLLPLLPLSVQNAIVAKLEQVLPLVDAYENAVLQKEELKSTLSDKVKKAILQEAITGKLTEQWRKQKAVVELVETTESGEQLLDRIIKERNAKALAEWEQKVKITPKAKKPVPIVASEIEEEEIPFEVPESWCWCKLYDVIELLSGRDLEPSAYNSISKGIPYMTGASNFENEELLVNRWTDKPVTISSLGDLLITCKGTIGELAFNHVGDVHIARQIMAIRKTDYINLKFLKFFLMSRVDEIQKQAKSMIPGISREDMLGFYFPLPPLEEQEEIVKKVEELLPLYNIPII